ncbi:signal peptidase II [Aquibium carbonis]|uniref:Lipoprotein signal peptidase n=1 Tax=Aquibium carbonis TaxID=2495581 RepID=A0A429YLY0_9HYPH|nr:signal peptidase II [Aquibium carbonis]RST82420.1 signal peptidase II [Aquibium carbonis]
MRWPAFFAVIVAGIGIDQWIKFLVETRMDMHELIDILPFLGLFRIHNTGIAFSMFAGMDRLFLIGLAVAVMIFVGWLAARTNPAHGLARLGFALILSGAFSNNLIDRLVLGYVVDYVLFHTPVWSFAVFNLADAFISVGAGLVILDEVFVWRRQARAGGPADGPRDG